MPQTSKPGREHMTDILNRNNIRLNLPVEFHEDAIRRAGKLLVEGGYVQERYVDGMIARNRSFSTAIGNHIAIPHGEKEYKQDILKTGICVLTYPQGLDWDGETVYLVVGIAARGEEHLDILNNIVDKLDTGEDVKKLVQMGSKDAILDLFTGAEV
jgi:mannitol/fructose-specific phosphotransferase system IIA component